jgi:hypothetical protein
MSYETQAIDMAKHHATGFDPIDCKSEGGLDITLIDGMMATATILARRLRERPIELAVWEALADFRQDADVKFLLQTGK